MLKTQLFKQTSENFLQKAPTHTQIVTFTPAHTVLLHPKTSTPMDPQHKLKFAKCQARLTHLRIGYGLSVSGGYACVRGLTRACFNDAKSVMPLSFSAARWLSFVYKKVIFGVDGKISCRGLTGLFCGVGCGALLAKWKLSSLAFGECALLSVFCLVEWNS